MTRLSSVACNAPDTLRIFPFFHENAESPSPSQHKYSTQRQSQKNSQRLSRCRIEIIEGKTVVGAGEYRVALPGN